jgi:prepilin-type N-terminal cleavage/methylation domain-containing protein
VNATRDRERGFTLIELMAVVVIIAVLAAVLIPTFTSESKKVKAKTEVSSMVAELASKQERYKTENNTYLATAECPTPASGTEKSVTSCMNTGVGWVLLGVVPPQQQLRCSYEITVGTSTDTPTVPSGATAFTIPAGCCATSWYIIHAKCDMDSNGTFSHYVTASFDASIRVTNEGQ